jgi:hypothetical protein
MGVGDYYVNMHDTFMSGWGPAKNGRSLYCIKCATKEQATAAYLAALERKEMTNVRISERPRRARPWSTPRTTPPPSPT